MYNAHIYMYGTLAYDRGMVPTNILGEINMVTQCETMLEPPVFFRSLEDNRKDWA
jgi:hypothetical protein